MQIDTADVVIEEIDPRSMSDAQITDLNTFDNLMGAEAEPSDPPAPLEITRSWTENIPDYEVLHQFWARGSDGEVVAIGGITWIVEEQNQHVANLGLAVRADHRRQGIAKELLRLVLPIPEQANRTLLIARTNDRVPAGDAFALRIGAEKGLVGHTNRSLLRDVDRDMVRQWLDEGPVRAPGYSLIAIDGAYPDEEIDAILDLHSVMNTAPRENLDMEDFYWTVEQMREMEKGLVASKTERWYVAARHDATGDLVGFTELSWNPSQPKTVYQWGTAVRPEHRGHAIGKWLKAANIQRVFDERPTVEDVRTHNADSNGPMLGINNLLGFRPWREEIMWQVRLEQAQSYLSGR